MARHIVAGAYTLEDVGVGFGDRSELGISVLARGGDFRDRDVVDHPTFIPTALVVNDKQWRNVSEDIVEGSWILGIGRKPRLGLQHDPHGADRRQSAISSGDGQLHVVIHPGKYSGKDVRFETSRVQQVILEQLTGRIGFGEHLHRRIGVRPVGQLNQPSLQIRR